MGRKFDIPLYYRSTVIAALKNARRVDDHRKKDLAPSVLDLGRVRFKVARHFGLCFGVENAIEIAYRAIAENPSKRVFLLSEMIHNPHVNSDLVARGVRFILAPDGSELFPFDKLQPDDIVIVPAFGTTVELLAKLREIGIDPQQYNATCPFVEKVWKRAHALGQRGFTIVIHGKHSHEETRATFSHATLTAPSVVIRDLGEATLLARYLRREIPFNQFYSDFAGRYSKGFDAARDLDRIGVVNQTTMLATETQAITDLLKRAMLENFGEADAGFHFADTRDTLCYATSENQDAVTGLVASGGDIAVVVGGYNSSNTSHLVELCEELLPTFYIKDADEIIDALTIRHLDLHAGEVKTTSNWIPRGKDRVDVLLTAGASCPDALVDRVIEKIAECFGAADKIEEALFPFLSMMNVPEAPAS